MFGGTSMSTGIREALDAQRLIRGDVARYGIFLSDGQNTETEAMLALRSRRGGTRDASVRIWLWQ